MLLPLFANAVAIHPQTLMRLGDWGIGIGLVISGTSFFFIEQLLSSLLNSYLVISVAVSFI